MLKDLVVFYSWGGNTKVVAEYIGQKTGAELLELKVKVPYPRDYRACVNQAGKEGKAYEPELAVSVPDLRGYGRIYVGSPCWWGTIANPVRTFLHQNNLTVKTIAPFMTHGTSGLHIADIKGLCPDSKILEGLGIYNCYQVSTTVDKPENMGDFHPLVDAWLQRINLS